MIRKCVIIGIVLLILISDGGVIIAQQIENEYELVFCDEFNQPNGSQPDSTRWKRAERNSSIWARWISNSKDVVFIKNGALVCRAIPNHTLSADTAEMLTGAVETLGKYAFQYGKVEVRMKTNKQDGNFPAAWMRPVPSSADARYGEIDIVEMFGQIGETYHTVHNHMSAEIGKKGGPVREFRHKVSFTKWHIYGVEWDENKIVWTVDGRKVGEYKRMNTPDMIRDGQWTFDRPFYLRLNQSVGDGSHERLHYPNTKKVYETQFDWIRVYQKKQ